MIAICRPATTLQSCDIEKSTGGACLIVLQFTEYFYETTVQEWNRLSRIENSLKIDLLASRTQLGDIRPRPV